tara:strand:+ start:1368 stop:1598 length:231 start_codon:yes stop_codon:yes gene_type:complete
MNNQTKLVFALEHVAHLHDLIEDNEWEQYLTEALCTLEFELERQLKLELDRKTNTPQPPRVSVAQARDELNGIKRH